METFMFVIACQQVVPFTQMSLFMLRNVILAGRSRAGSRIFRRGGVDPFWGGFGLQRGHFSVKMYAKTKELDPVGGRAPARPPLDPPMRRKLFQNYISYCTQAI